MTLLKHAPSLDVEKIREDFPILQREVNGKRLVYFDNAATTQKPVQVIEAIDHYYRWYNSNIHRGIHKLAEEATASYEESRAKIASFIGARRPEEIIFVRGTTEAINLVAYAWGRHNIQKGDRIVTTMMEHHSNIVPWQLLAKEKGAILDFVDIDDRGRLRMDQLYEFLENGTKLLCLAYVSNVLGTLNPVAEIIERAHKYTAKVLVDAAQAVPHLPVNVQALDCDFFAFSGHKMLGPTGIGILYAKRDLLDSMLPFHGGGEMIREVQLHESTWKDPPYKFEAGTVNIEGGIVLGVAVDYLEKIGLENIHRYEKELTAYALKRLSEHGDVEVYGPNDPEDQVGIISFNLGKLHPHDLATILDEEGIAVRSGHHCAQPLMRRLDAVATTRASFYLYNTSSEVDRLCEAFEEARRIFR